MSRNGILGFEAGREGVKAKASVNPLALVGHRAEQLRRRARYPAPDHAGQLVITAAQPLGLPLCNLRRGSAVSADQQQSRLPDLALVGHHHRGHHTRKAPRFTEVPAT